MVARARKSAEYTWRSRAGQSLHFAKTSGATAASDVARIVARIAFNQNGIAELVRAEPCALESLIRALEHVYVRERVQQLVVTAPRLVRSRENRIDNSEPRRATESLSRDRLARNDSAVRFDRMLESAHDRRAYRDDTTTLFARAPERVDRACRD